MSSVEPSDTLDFILCFLSWEFLVANGDPLWEWSEVLSIPRAASTWGKSSNCRPQNQTEIGICVSQKQLWGWGI